MIINAKGEPSQKERHADITALLVEFTAPVISYPLHPTPTPMYLDLINPLTIAKLQEIQVRKEHDMTLQGFNQTKTDWKTLQDKQPGFLQRILREKRKGKSSSLEIIICSVWLFFGLQLKQTIKKLWLFWSNWKSKHLLDVYYYKKLLDVTLVSVIFLSPCHLVIDTKIFTDKMIYYYILLQNNMVREEGYDYGYQ